MTMVVSTKGNVTDSHSDDPDGTNHCFTGSKVWLMWDTFDGLRHGLEDCQRVDVYDQSAFDMDTFLRLRSSRWLVINEGQTLFLPGDYTHKVVTTKKYLGVGSFYVSLPNALRTLSRWLINEPLWSIDGRSTENANLVAEIAQVLTDVITEVASANQKTRKAYGLDFLPAAVRRWRETESASHKNRLKADKSFARFLSCAMSI